MLNSSNKYKYYKKKKSSFKKLILITAILILFTGLFVFLLFMFNQGADTNVTEIEETRSLFDLWNDGLYSEVISV